MQEHCLVENVASCVATFQVETCNLLLLKPRNSDKKKVLEIFHSARPKTKEIKNATRIYNILAYYEA